MARHRLIAILEVFVCSGFPTQMAIAGLLAFSGIAPLDAAGRLSSTYVCVLTLSDATVLVALVIWFLRLHGERPRDVLVGDRPVAREAVLGALQVPVLFLAVVVLMVGIQHVAPWLRNVTRNPFEGLIRTRADAWLFGAVAVLGGGVREEVQRAFVLHRFRQSLGGAAVGLVLSSLAFGLGHVIQGRDVATVTSLLGAFWGVVYLKRRTIVSTVVSHSGFNAAEIFRYTFYGA